MFSIVRRSKREAEKAKLADSKKKVRSLREQLKALRARSKKLKKSRDEARSLAFGMQAGAGASPSSPVLQRMSLAESRVAELEAALLVAESRPLPSQLSYPLPPPDLRRRIGSNYAGIEFLDGAKRLSDQLSKLLRDGGVEAASIRDVLDWGCGCGRVARHAREIFPNAAYHGLDIDTEAIEWCRANMSAAGTFDLCAELPPTQLPDRSFDLIFAFSVFTHLRLDAEKQWLAELERLARPGAVLVLSYLSEEAVAGFGLVPAQRVDSEAGFNCYATWAEDGMPYFNLTSSHTEECLRDLWGKRFEILSVIPGALGLQGVVLARARQ